MTHSLSESGGLEQADDGAQELDLELVTEQILSDPGLTQYTLRRNEDGNDTMVGYFRCQMQQNQQRYALHVPIYPAMDNLPDVEAIVMDSDQAMVRITERKKYGLRMEVVLANPTTEKIDYMVEVVASATNE